MAAAFRHLASFVVVALLFGCVTGASLPDSGSSLLEKSRADAPDWASRDKGKWHAEPSGHRFVTIKEPHHDLPLGLKQSQLFALKESRAELARHVSERAMRRLDLERLTAKAENEVEMQAHAVALDAHDRYARIADIYYEKRRDGRYGDRDWFRIVVLVEMSRAAIDGIMTDVAARLTRSQDSELRRQGSRVGKPDDGFSH